MSTLPQEILQSGVEIMRPLFEEHGFAFEMTGNGTGSGGNFASGVFRREKRKLELHFRYSLGLVRYHLGANSISHESYMWSVFGKPHLSKYPGFSGDALKSFHNLLEDIEKNGADFLTGTDAEFMNHIERAAKLEAERPKLPL